MLKPDKKVKTGSRTLAKMSDRDQGAGRDNRRRTPSGASHPGLRRHRLRQDQACHGVSGARLRRSMTSRASICRLKNAPKN